MVHLTEPTTCGPLCGFIGLQGFEPWTSPTRTARSTKLSHNPNKTGPSSGKERVEGHFGRFEGGGKLEADDSCLKDSEGAVADKVGMISFHGCAGQAQT
jgi:hypothetical protein